MTRLRQAQSTGPLRRTVSFDCGYRRAQDMLRQAQDGRMGSLWRTVSFDCGYRRAQDMLRRAQDERNSISEMGS